MVLIFVHPLPDSSGDAQYFEKKAYELAELGLWEVIRQFKVFSSYSISSVLALLYVFTDRSILVAQSFSLLFGMGTVFLGWSLAGRLWGDHAAMKAVGY